MSVVSTKPKGLKALSTEVVQNVARFLDDESLSALRLTSKQQAQQTHYEIVARKIKNLRVGLNVHELEQAIQMVQALEGANEVRHIELVVTLPTDLESARLIPTSEFNPDKMYQLLGQLFAQQLNSLQEIVVTGSHSFLEFQESHTNAGVAKLLQFMGELSVRKLTHLKIDSVNATADALVKILSNNTASLTSVRLMGIKLVTPRDWSQVFETIGSQLTLNRLYLSSFRGPNSTLEFHNGPERNVCRALRNSSTGKIEHYGMSSNEVRAFGSQAIQEALKFLTLNIPMLGW